MSTPIDGASPFVVDRISGRFVMIADPDGLHSVLSTPFLARERSVHELRGQVLQHCCELASGDRFTVPPGWVSECPTNVVPFWWRA